MSTPAFSSRRRFVAAAPIGLLLLPEIVTSARAADMASLKAAAAKAREMLQRAHMEHAKLVQKLAGEKEFAAKYYAAVRKKDAMAVAQMHKDAGLDAAAPLGFQLICWGDDVRLMLPRDPGATTRLHGAAHDTAAQEADRFLGRIAAEDAFASKLDAVADKRDRRQALALLREGGVAKSQVASVTFTSPAGRCKPKYFGFQFGWFCFIGFHWDV